MTTKPQVDIVSITDEVLKDIWSENGWVLDGRLFVRDARFPGELAPAEYQKNVVTMQKKYGGGDRGWVFSVKYALAGERDYFSVPVGFKIGEQQEGAVSQVVDGVDDVVRKVRVNRFLFIDASSDIPETIESLFRSRGYEARFHGHTAHQPFYLYASPMTIR